MIWSCLNLAQLSTLSIIPDLETGDQNRAERQGATTRTFLDEVFRQLAFAAKC